MQIERQRQKCEMNESEENESDMRKGEKRIDNIFYKGGLDEI